MASNLSSDETIILHDHSSRRKARVRMIDLLNVHSLMVSLINNTPILRRIFVCLQGATKPLKTITMQFIAYGQALKPQKPRE